MTQFFFRAQDLGNLPIRVVYTGKRTNFDWNEKECYHLLMKIITNFIKLRIWGLLMNLINLMNTVLKIYPSGEKLII